MRGLIACLALSACVDSGQPLSIPPAPRSLAFLVWVDGPTVSRVSEAFSIGEDDGLLGALETRRSNESVVLVSFQLDQLRAITPLVDEARLMASSLSVGADPVCESRFIDGRTSLSHGLPDDAQIESLLPAEVSSDDHGFIRAQLRLELPLADRACSPPFRVDHFALNGEALSDGFVYAGQPLTRGNRSWDPFFELRDAQYLTPDEAIIVLGRGVFILRRGERILDETGPNYWKASDPIFPWPPGSDIDSLVVLPEYSDASRQRLIMVATHRTSEDDASTWAVTVERAGLELTVSSSTFTPGFSVRAEIDHRGRAVWGAREQMQERGALLWSEDGVRFSRRGVPYEPHAIAPTDDLLRPHLVFRRGLATMDYGDVTAAERAFTTLGLDPQFRESVRSGAGLRVGDALRVALAGEERALRRLDMSSNPPTPEDWTSIRPHIDSSTLRAGCTDLPEVCGEVDLPAEGDQISLLASGGRIWTILFPKNCDHLIVFRDDDCTTHMSLQPVVPTTTERRMISIRRSPDGRRALLAGGGGRLFELSVEP